MRQLSTDDDLKPLAAIHAASFADAWDTRAIGELLATPGTFAFADDHGFILVRAATVEAEILTLAVSPAARRNGLGRTLVDAAASHAQVLGAAVMFLEVAVSNTAARALYDRLGFIEAGRRKGYYATGREMPEDALVLRAELPLSPPWENRRHWLKSGHEPARPEQPVTRIEKICAEKGLRMTEQRRVIARVLSDAVDHPDAEELYKRSSAIDPHISIATVYRTVKLFEDAGILERHDFRDGRSRYEEAPESHHDHLIDIQSGSVIEFRNEDIEKLQRRVAEELGFELVDHRLELYGVPKGSKKPR